MYYKSEDIDKLIDELNIVDVVGEFVELKKAGSNYKGLCPFHADTNPSFVVNPNKNICKCFVCETGGNAVTFYSKYKKIPFYEAVKELANKYKINIKEEKSDKNTDELEKYFNLMEESHKFFMENIFSVDARNALEYLSNRGLDTKLIKEHQLGYASGKWSLLYDYLLEKGYNFEDILTLGLVKRKDDKIYDTFRDRIIFPIYSSHGRVIAFGGRSLENKENIPKYINSPDTPIFKKGKNIYGIERARNIKNKNYSILMEGYMDVLSSCIYGFDTSVAPLGTALTEEQAKLIKRYSSNILISFDMDKAGIAATERATYILKSQGFNIRVLEFQNAKDPDEFLKKYGKDGFLKVVKNSLEIFDFLYNLFLKEYDIKNTISKQNFIEKFGEFFISINNDLEKEIYLKKLSEKVDIDINILRKTLLANNKKINFKRLENIEHNKEDRENRKKNYKYNLEILLIKIILKNPEYFKFFENEKMDFEITNKIFKFFEKKIKENLILSSIDIVKDLRNFMEESNEFSEAEKNDELPTILMNYATELSENNETQNLELLKGYFRYKMKERDKSKENLQEITEIGIFYKKIESAKNVDELMEIYKINKHLLTKKL